MKTILVRLSRLFSPTSALNPASQGLPVAIRRKPDLIEKPRATGPREISSSVNHEIRTMMNGILGVAELLQGSALTLEQKQLVDALSNSSKGLFTILGDILDFSDLKTGAGEVKTKSFVLRDLCEESVSIFSAAAHAKKLDIQLLLLNNLPKHTSGDAERIRKVLICLLGNAVRFSDAGMISLAATPMVGRRGWVRFTVKDAGIGMSRDTLDNLFEPYAEVELSREKKFGSTGLGLAICKKLVTQLGGSISAESQLGHGSIFKVEIPLPESTETAGENPTMATHDFSGIRVLLAEDNAVNRMVAVKMLQRLNVQVDLAANGVEAVNAWAKGTYGLILMDCQMPEMDGYAAARQIRLQEKANGSQCHIPIVALTAHALEEDRKACLESGMDAFLAKPVIFDTLRLALETWAKRPAPAVFLDQNSSVNSVAA